MRSTLLVAALVFVPLLGRADDTAAFLKADNWESLPDLFTIKDTTVIGKTVVDPKFNTFLCSKKKYKNFEMTFEARLLDGKGNSGIQIRSEKIDPAKYIVKGPQVDIGKGYWGSLYGEKFGGMMKQAPAAEINKALKDTDFNKFVIKAVGKHVTISVNGITAVDQDFEKLPEEGIIAFQIHAGFPTMEVTFRNIVFTELK